MYVRIIIALCPLRCYRGSLAVFNNDIEIQDEITLGSRSKATFPTISLENDI